MKRVPLFGSGMAGFSYPVTRQRRLNCYYDNRPDQDKTKVAIYGTPGLKPLAPTFLTVSGSTPIRGIFGTQTQFWLSQYNQLIQYNSAGHVQYVVNTISNTGHVEFNVNQTQLILVDGTFGYILNRNTGSFMQIGGSGFPNGARTVASISGFFICEQPGTPSFYVSTLNDGTQAWSTASAFQYADFIQAVDQLDGNLIPFCQQHLEFWQNVGTSPQPFAIIPSATAPFGLAAVFSRAHVGDSIIFLAQDQSGGIHLARIVGYTVSIISNSDFDYIVRQFSTVSDAVALTYSANGHPMYQITFPTANRSFLYDATTGLMSETQTGVTQNYAQRHTGQYSAYFNGTTIVSDQTQPVLYTMDPGTYTDGGQTIEREIITRHVNNDFNTLVVDELYLDMETGAGNQGQFPQVMMQVSKDNGRTWSGERWKSLGNQGQYVTRMKWDRCGATTNGEDMVFRFRMTDPAKFVITDGAMNVSTYPQ